MTTKLEVLNHMLGVIGETPVSDPESSHPSVLSAAVQLNRVNKEMQVRGWWFNTEYDLKLQPNESGHIVIPAGTLYIDPLTPYSKLTKRGGKLYDPVNHTFNIGKEISVDVMLLLPIEDLPETAAMYVQHKAAYDFYVNDDGDETKSNRLKMEVDTSWAALHSEELRQSGVNAHDRPTSRLLRYRMTHQAGQYNPQYHGGRA